MDFFKEIIYYFISATTIIGGITYLAKKHIEHRLKNLETETNVRFNRIYNDQTDQWKKTYKQLVLVERNLEELIRPVRLNPKETKEMIAQKALTSVQELFFDFEENKILFETETIKILEEIKTKVEKAWKIHIDIQVYKELDLKDDLYKAVTESSKFYEEELLKKLPELKENLRQDLRNKLRIS